MNTVWKSLLTGIVMITAAALVVGGEPATAELRIVEAATRVMDAEAQPAEAGAPATPERAIASRD